MGYCGADLRALCTEAALFALRRKYPQIYSTTEKLVLDTSKINVAASDFLNALKSVIPTAQRSDNSIALALPEHIRPLFLQSLVRLLDMLCFLFPPSWKLVSKATGGLESLLAAERAAVGRMEGKLEELRERCSPSIPGVGGNERLVDGTKASSVPVDALAVQSRDTVVTAGKKLSRSVVSKRTRTKNRANSNGDLSARHSDDIAATSTLYPNISNWSGDLSDSKNHSLRLASKQQHHHPYLTIRPLGSAVSSSCGLEHSRSANINEVFFDLTEVSSEDQLKSTTSDRNSILMDTNAAETSPRTAPAGNLQSLRYLNFSSHPHAPPAVHHPRLVLCGQGGMGQSSYLGPALLHALEELPVKTMDLSTLFGSSTKSPEEACAQVVI